MKWMIMLAALGAVGCGRTAAPVLPAELGDRIAQAEMVALFVFQDEDCQGRLTALRRLAALQGIGSIAVLGLRVNRGAEDAAARVGADDATGGAFAVVDDPGAARAITRLALAMGYGETPILMAVDRRGRVRFASPVPGDSAAQVAVVRLLEQHGRGAAAEPGR